ncbi:MAG: FHA domain-containing protein [Burkholderiaceae bacterium]|nr:FHA domain-containing protein [Burkholderiaceae bacterium]
MAKVVLTVDGTVLKELPLAKSRIAIGRRATNDLVINHVAVSGLHAAIVAQQGKFFVEDLNSTNGTQLNGQTIVRQQLQDRDVIEIPPYQIQFHAENEQAALTDHVDTVKLQLDEIAAEAGGLDSGTVLQEFAVLRVLDGASAGQEHALSKPVTTFGHPGVQVAVLTQRKQSYFISHVEGTETPRVNGIPIGEGSRRLKYDDVIELSGTKIKFCRDE